MLLSTLAFSYIAIKHPSYIPPIRILQCVARYPKSLGIPIAFDEDLRSGRGRDGNDCHYIWLYQIPISSSLGVLLDLYSLCPFVNMNTLESDMSGKDLACAFR